MEKVRDQECEKYVIENQILYTNNDEDRMNLNEYFYCKYDDQDIIYEPCCDDIKCDSSDPLYYNSLLFGGE